MLPLLLAGLSKFELDSVDAVYAVNEEDQDEDECNFHPILQLRYDGTFGARDRVSRCTRHGGKGAYMNVNIFLRMVNGRGTMRSMKSVISATSRRKTWID